MNRSQVLALTVTLLASASLAQTRVDVRRLLGALPLTSSDRVFGSKRAFLYSTPEGHELQINWRRDSSVYAFIAHPSKSVESEDRRTAFVRQVAVNAFGNDSAVTSLFRRAAEKQDKPSSIQHELETSGWTLTLIVHNNRISRLLARARNATQH
jgi:hypothetical protein